MSVRNVISMNFTSQEAENDGLDKYHTEHKATALYAWEIIVASSTVMLFI